MHFPSPLLSGTLVKRYKRFLADITLDDGQEITAHCANSGSMMGLKEPGSKVWVTKVHDSSDRKLRYDWHLVQPSNTTCRVGINTSTPNKIVEEALNQQKIEPLSAYKTVRREVKYGAQNSRIDFLLSQDGLPDCYVEVKNVTLKQNNAVAFPDAVTTRGAKHMQELALMKDQGHRAVVIYVVQRTDGEHFEIAADIDLEYAEAVAHAKSKGVEFFAYTCAITDTYIELNTPLSIKS